MDVPNSFENKKYTAVPLIIPNIVPNNDPSHVLLGLILGHILCFPKNVPIKYAPVSVINTVINKYAIK